MFVNRIIELEKLAAIRSNLTVIFGRRRVGKTELVLESFRKAPSATKRYYSQAIEGPESLQISQVLQDIQPLIPNIEVRTWFEFFRLLARVSELATLVIDEFPYLVKSQNSLPSILQKFLDHDCPENLSIILLGSSQTMMHSLFLSGQAPLYERAGKILHIGPMSYQHFCEAKEIDPLQSTNFMHYALVGGVPKYWQFIDPMKSPVESADMLYFENGARLESEPDRLLKDENLVGEQAKSILELVGRGVNRPSEMASRMGIKQTSLSNPLQALIHASLLNREIPFGESLRTTKRTLYRLVDPVLAFWYSVYSPHRTLWNRYTLEQKEKLLRDHASLVFEGEYRRHFPDGQRYWENKLEFDCIRYSDHTGKKIIISEVKFTILSAREQAALKRDLISRFQQSKLFVSYEAMFEVVDINQGLALIAG